MTDRADLVWSFRRLPAAESANIGVIPVLNPRFSLEAGPGVFAFTEAMVLTADEVRQLFDYDPESGVLRRKSSGKAVGWNVNGYLQVGIAYRQYLVHRIIFLIVYGYMPVQVDHIDGNRTNNRLDNLREASSRDNNRNRRRLKNNSSGCVGVWKDGSVWRASIGVNGITQKLGTFRVFDDAVAARKKAEEELGYHPNHGRS